MDTRHIEDVHGEARFRRSSKDPNARVRQPQICGEENELRARGRNAIPTDSHLCTFSVYGLLFA